MRYNLLLLLLVFGVSCNLKNFYVDQRGHRVYGLDPRNSLPMVTDSFELTVQPTKIDTLFNAPIKCLEFVVTIRNKQDTSLNILLSNFELTLEGIGPDSQRLSDQSFGFYNPTYDWSKHIKSLKSKESITTNFPVCAVRYTLGSQKYFEPGLYKLKFRYRNVISRVDETFLPVGDLFSDYVEIDLRK